MKVKLLVSLILIETSFFPALASAAKAQNFHVTIKPIGESKSSLSINLAINETAIKIADSSIFLNHIYVSALNDCVDSGINISRGELLRFSATGQARYGYEGEPINDSPITDANGNRLVNGNNIGKKIDPSAQMPNQPIGTLIGRIGRNGNLFAIGSSNQLMMRESGRLFLCYNDVPDMFGNNGGGYTVSISRIEAGSQNPTNPSPCGQQTVTAPTRPTRQTFRNVRELGMAQFLQGNRELIDAYQALQGAAQGQYNVVEIPSNDFMDNPFTQIARERGAWFGGGGSWGDDREDIGYADYLKLKLKLNAQIAAYNNSLAIIEKMQDYNNRLSTENRQGGREVSQRIVANFQTLWSRIEQQNQPDLSLDRILSSLAYAVEESRVSTIHFVIKSAQTGGKLAAAFSDFGKLGQLLNLPISSNADATQLTGRKLDYAITVYEKLQEFERNFKKGDYEALLYINLEIANATIGLFDPQNNPRLVRAGQGIAILSEATKLRDMMILLQQPNVREVLDDYDRFYLTVAGISSALKIGADTVTLINPNPQQSASQIAAKVKAINDLLFEGLQITYKDEFRRKYERLIVHNNQLQDRILGLSSSINYAADQVGEYLLKSRADAVTRRADGTIAVSVDGVLYPPNSP